MDYNLHTNYAQAPLAYPQYSAINAPAPCLAAGPHAAAACCRHRGRFLKWLETRTPDERRVRHQQGRPQAMIARPHNVVPRAYVADLGNVGTVPSTMAEVSASMHALVGGEGQS